MARASPYLLLVLTVLFWAGNFVVGRAVQGLLPPIAMAFWRWAIALAIILPLVAAPLVRQWPLLRQHWRPLVLLGVLGVGCFNTLVYIGLGSTTATNGALLNSAIPVLILLLGRALFGDPLAPRQAAGVALSLAGVVVIVARGDLAGILALHLNPGDLWVLAAVLSWALYTLCLRWRPPGLDPRAFMGATVLVGLAAIAPFYAAEFLAGARPVLTPATLAALAYFGLFPSVLSFFFWNRAVAEVGAARAGLFIHLLPVFGTLLSMVFLGERLQPFHAAGAALVFGGIGLCLAVRRPA